MKYRMPLYHLKVTQPDGSVRIINTASRSIVELDPDYQQLLRRVIDDPSFIDLLDEPTRNNIDELIEQGIITNQSIEDEKDSVLRQLKIYKENEGNLIVTFGVTFACNFNCVYCIQKGNYEHRPTMSDQVISKSMDLISKYVDTFKINRFAANLFGGEPSLAFDSLMNIMDRVDELHSRHQFVKPPEFQMVTNGYELDEEKLQILRDKRLKSMQITIDGTRGTHNSRRPHVKGYDTFDKLWENILIATKLGIYTCVLTVVDHMNHQDLFPVLEMAYEKFAVLPDAKKNVVFNFGRLLPSHQTCKRDQQYLYGKEMEIETTIMQAKKLGKEMGFKIDEPISVGACFRESEHAMLIDPKGDIYGCYSTLGDKKYKLSDIDEPPKSIAESIRQFAELKAWDDNCLDCSVFPICKGGCQYEASLTNNGEYGHKLCQKKDTQRFLEQHVAYGIF